MDKKEEALQRITDYETIAMHGSREELQDALDKTAETLYLIVKDHVEEQSLPNALDTILQNLPPLHED